VPDKHGILRTRHTRAAFLNAAAHHLAFRDTPKHVSWLSQIASWLSILTRKLLRRRAFISLEDLTAQVFAFIAYAKRTMARPSRRPTTVSRSLSKRKAI